MSILLLLVHISTISMFTLFSGLMVVITIDINFNHTMYTMWFVNFNLLQFYAILSWSSYLVHPVRLKRSPPAASGAFKVRTVPRWQAPFAHAQSARVILACLRHGWDAAGVEPQISWFRVPSSNFIQLCKMVYLTWNYDLLLFTHHQWWFP